MGIIFTPSTPLPSSDTDVETAVWYCVWDAPWASRRLLAPGATVYLHDGARQMVRWETVLTDVIAVPFESADAFRDHLQRRWQTWVTPLDDGGPVPGFGVAWKAQALRQLAALRPDGSPELKQWASVCGLDDGWCSALGLPIDEPCTCQN